MTEATLNAYQIETSQIEAEKLQTIINLSWTLGINAWVDGLFVVYKANPEMSQQLMAEIKNHQIYVKSTRRTRAA